MSNIRQEEANTYTGKTYKLHTESWDLNQEPSCCEATVLNTVQSRSKTCRGKKKIQPKSGTKTNIK